MPLRALGQWLRHGRVVSGASTLTMQAARLLEPHARDLSGKLGEMLRACNSVAYNMGQRFLKAST